MRQLIADGWSAHQAADRVRESSDSELAALAHPVVPAAIDASLRGFSRRRYIEGGAAGALVARLSRRGAGA